MDVTILKTEFLKQYLHIKDRFEKYCLALTGDSDEAKDVASEAILLTYEGFAKIRNRKSFIFYLFKVAKRVNYRRIRSKVESVDYAKQDLISTETDPFQSFYFVQLHQSIQKLPEKLSTALILYELSGFSMKEVAEIQKCSESAAKVRVLRARKKLHKILEDNEKVPLTISKQA